MHLLFLLNYSFLMVVYWGLNMLLLFSASDYFPLKVSGKESPKAFAYIFFSFLVPPANLF